MNGKYLPVSTSLRGVAPQQHSYGIGGTRGWTLFLVAALSLVLMNSAFSIILTVIPDIAKDFHTTEDLVIWIVTSSNIASTCLQPAAGKLGDVFGYGKIWILGMIVRILSMTASGLSLKLEYLILSATISGIGSALDGPSGIALVVRSFPENMRPVLISFMTATGTTSQTVGLLVGGVIASLFGWRVLYLGPVPLLVIITVLASFALYCGQSKKQENDFNNSFPLDDNEIDLSLHSSTHVVCTSPLHVVTTIIDHDMSSIDDVMDGNCAHGEGDDDDIVILFQNKKQLMVNNFENNATKSVELQHGIIEIDAADEDYHEVQPGDIGGGGSSMNWQSSLLGFDWIGTIVLCLLSTQLLFTVSSTFSSPSDQSIEEWLVYIDPNGPLHNLLKTYLHKVFISLQWIGFVFLTVILFNIEQMHKEPILPPELFGHPVIARAIFANTLLWIPYMGSWLMMPLFMRDCLHWSPGKAAGLLVLRPVANGIAGPLAGILLRKFSGERDKPGGEGICTTVLLLASWTLQMVSYVLLSYWVNPTVLTVFERPLWMFQLLCLIMGAGTGLANNALVSLVAAEAPKEMLGSALGVLRTAQGLASLISWAAVGAVVSGHSNLTPYSNTAIAFNCCHICSLAFPLWLLFRSVLCRRKGLDIGNIVAT
eukprot:gene2938-5773_t